MSRFITLSEVSHTQGTDFKPLYVNPDGITRMKSVGDGSVTEIWFTDGKSELVKETPVEIDSIITNS